jgi:hypothetical protein
MHSHRRIVKTMNGYEMKIIFYYLVFICLFSISGCYQAEVKPNYHFDRGTVLKKQFLPEEKIVEPTLTLIDLNKKYTFPLGASIWHETKDHHYLYIKYPDRRFSAFLTYAIEVINTQQAKRRLLLENIVYYHDMIDDRFIVGVRRVPSQKDDNLYENGTFTLVVTDVTYNPLITSTHAVTTGNHLPDFNHINSNEDEIDIKKHFYIHNHSLKYQTSTGQMKSINLKP